MVTSMPNWLMAAVIIAPSPAIPVHAGDLSSASKTAWDGRLQKAMSTDLDGVMADFTDQSAIVVVNKVCTGAAAVRGYLGSVIQGFWPELLKSIVMQAEVPFDNVVYAKLAIGNAKRTFVYTAVIQDRKILMITETDFPAG